VSEGRRRLGNILRVLLTAAAVAVVVAMIRFRDFVRIEEAPGKVRIAGRDEILRIERREGRTVVFWAGGGVSEHAPGDVTEQEGFLSLFGRVDKGLFAAMVAALLVPTLAMALRWRLLLRGHGFEAPLGRTFLVTYAGLFFNNFLPGSVGGDLARAVLASSGETRKAAVAGTVILDRLIGLGVMIVLGGACLIPFAPRFRDRTPVLVALGLFGGMILAYLAYFSPWLRGRLRDRLPFRRTLGELDGVFRSVRERPALVAAAAGLSLLSQGASILVAYGLAQALGAGGVPIWMFFVFEPIIFIVTAVPVSVGGWGVQEGAYAYLFGTLAGMGTTQAVALSVLFKLSWILVSIPGGILFALGAARRSEGVSLSAGRPL